MISYISGARHNRVNTICYDVLAIRATDHGRDKASHGLRIFVSMANLRAGGYG
jgi:hypothetical protein